MTIRAKTTYNRRDGDNERLGRALQRRQRALHCPEVRERVDGEGAAHLGGRELSQRLAAHDACVKEHIPLSARLTRTDSLPLRAHRRC